MRKFHEMAADDPAFAHQPMTLGSMSKALADSKEAFASACSLADRVDDVDELLEDLAKSSDALVKLLAVKGKAIDGASPSSEPRLTATSRRMFSRRRWLGREGFSRSSGRGKSPRDIPA